ncbi:MAG: helix-turn-helix domain-containing protein [Lutibacter sp.]|jgi:DNA-binding Xre family transcriptional regulator
MQLDIDYIKTIMDANEIKPKSLAKRLNKTDSWTYLMLQGKAGRTFKIVEQLAKALKCRERDVIKFKNMHI